MTTIRSDNPIETSSEDTLGRDKLASIFSTQILNLDYQYGSVVGVLGPWGSGKTSFVNLILQHLTDSKIKALEFNPWMFSGTEQLIHIFFEEISAQLNLSDKLSDVAEGMKDYGEIFSGLSWIPIVGSIMAQGGSAAEKFGDQLAKRKGGALHKKRKSKKRFSELINL